MTVLGYFQKGDILKVGQSQPVDIGGYNQSSLRVISVRGDYGW